MPTHEQLVEIVTFRESGLDDITSRAQTFGKVVDENRRRSQAFAEALNDPAYTRHTAKAREMAREGERHALALKNQQRAADLASGAFARHTREMARLSAEARKLDRREELAGLVATHGRWGAVLRSNAAELAFLGRTLGGVAGMGVALGVGLARSGLQGTVEGYRLEMQWTRLSRQLAAVAIPAVDMLARHVGQAADWFQSLSGTQQDNILKFGLITAGALAFAGALRVVVAVGGAALGVVRGIAAVGSMAVAGGALASAPVAAAGVAGAGGAAAAGAAGAGAGLAGRLGMGAAAVGMPLAAGAIGGGLGLGGEFVGGAAAFGAGRAILGGAGVRGAVGGAARLAAPVAAGVAVGDAATGGFYSMLRREGHSMVGSGLGALGGGAFNLLTGGAFKDRLVSTGRMTGEDTGAAAAGKKHRDVMPLQVAQEELGGAHFRIQEEFLKVSAAMADEARAKAEADKAATEAAKALKESIDRLDARIKEHTERAMDRAAAPFGRDPHGVGAYADYLKSLLGR